MAVNPFDTLHDQDIQTAMANSNGVRHPLFIPGDQAPHPLCLLSNSRDLRIILRSAGQETDLSTRAAG
jgi:hypothetical protein